MWNEARKKIAGAANFFARTAAAVTSSATGHVLIESVLDATQVKYKLRGAEGGEYGTFSTETHIESAFKPK